MNDKLYHHRKCHTTKFMSNKQVINMPKTIATKSQLRLKVESTTRGTYILKQTYKVADTDTHDERQT